MLVMDTQPSEAKSLIERKIKKPTTRPAPASAVPTTPGNDGEDAQAGNANDAAAVLTAIDEDEEGGEEAQLPDEFDYYSDPEQDGTS